MSEPVIFSILETDNGKKIARATLNKPKALNALGQDMIDLLLPQMKAWQNDNDVVCVLLDSEGDKAFCAGGDVVAMYNAMKASPESVPSSLQRFFTDEYELDYLIHTYAKPVIVWGNGIVMGGGMGLMSGASHRIVTETSRLAMPEITIGLYPDVGGSWFLNNMPTGCGLFLGLTGASMNATDALYVYLADHFIPHEQKASFEAQLKGLKWGSSERLNREKLTDLCQQLHRDFKVQLPQGNVKAHQSVIEQVTDKSNVADVVDAILNLDTGTDKWLSRAQKGLAAGSPITMHLVYEQLKHAQGKSLADCFRMELAMSCRCGEVGEFQEGVRALLIDKDNQPAWKFSSVRDVDQALIASFFEDRWAGTEHPLAHLG